MTIATWQRCGLIVFMAALTAVGARAQTWYGPAPHVSSTDSPFDQDSVHGIAVEFDTSAFGMLPERVGIVCTYGTYHAHVMFESFDPEGASLGTVAGPELGDNTYVGTTGEDRFFGVSHDGGASRIHIFCIDTGK